MLLVSHPKNTSAIRAGNFRAFSPSFLLFCHHQCHGNPLAPVASWDPPTAATRQSGLCATSMALATNPLRRCSNPAPCLHQDSSAPECQCGQASPETTMPEDGGMSPMQEDGGVSPLPVNRGVSPLPEDGGVSPPPEDSGVAQLPEDFGVSPLPEDCGVSTMPEAPRARLAREPSLFAPNTPSHRATPHYFSRFPSSSLSHRGTRTSSNTSTSAYASRSLQAFALGTTHWVDPNELQLNLNLSSTALRERRIVQRAHGCAQLVPRTSRSVRVENQMDPFFDIVASTKTERRAARSQRLQELLLELGKRTTQPAQNSW